jgi:small subunit ribosomal protein S6
MPPSQNSSGASAPLTYDLVLLLDTEVEQGARAGVLKDVKQSISSSGELVRHDEWGNRELAYPIRHREQAEYHLLQFHPANPELLRGLDRSLRIADEVLRFRIVKLKPGTPDPPDMRRGHPVADHATAAAPSAPAKPSAPAEPSAAPQPSVAAEPSAAPQPSAAPEPSTAAEPSAAAEPAAAAEPSAAAEPAEPQAPDAPEPARNTVDADAVPAEPQDSPQDSAASESA